MKLPACSDPSAQMCEAHACRTAADCDSKFHLCTQFIIQMAAGIHTLSVDRSWSWATANEQEMIGRVQIYNRRWSIIMTEDCMMRHLNVDMGRLRGGGGGRAWESRACVAYSCSCACYLIFACLQQAEGEHAADTKTRTYTSMHA